MGSTCHRVTRANFTRVSGAAVLSRNRQTTCDTASLYLAKREMHSSVSFTIKSTAGLVAQQDNREARHKGQPRCPLARPCSGTEPAGQAAA